MNEQRYRQAEQKVWAHAGRTPTEHRIRLAASGVQVRVQEVGEGPPVLFIHGSLNSGGTWALLAARLPHLRCLLVDRPGTGLSEPFLLDATTTESFADRFVAEALDGLGIDRADLVASSFGGYIALRSTAAHPDRISRIVQMGCPALVAGATVPLFMRLMMVPGLRQLLGALPPSEGEARMSLRQMGHGPSLGADRIPQVLINWYLALQRYTDTMSSHEMPLISAGSFWRGSDLWPSLTLDSRLLRSVRIPIYFLMGPDDPFGGSEVAERLVAELPNAELELLPGAGHFPWYDDPDHAASVIRRFLDVHRRSLRSA